MNLTIKNFPEQVYETLKKEAVAHKRSLNSEIIHALEQATELARRREGMLRSRAALERFVASQKPMSDSTKIIRAERDRR